MQCGAFWSRASTRPFNPQATNKDESTKMFNNFIAKSCTNFQAHAEAIFENNAINIG